MGSSASAHVALESGGDFSAQIANLTTSSIFLRTHHQVRFREKVRVTVFSVSLDGEVVHASSDPPGFLVSFTAPPHTLRVIEERMHTVSVVWPDTIRQFDRQPTLANMVAPSLAQRLVADFDEPTNTGAPPISVPDEVETCEVLNTPPGKARVKDAPRLRATTVVGEHKTEEVVFDEPTEDGYQD